VSIVSTEMGLLVGLGFQRGGEIWRDLMSEIILFLALKVLKTACEVCMSYDKLSASPCPQSKFDAIHINFKYFFPVIPISSSGCGAV
jgi:hypothetical protein